MKLHSPPHLLVSVLLASLLTSLVHADSRPSIEVIDSADRLDATAVAIVALTVDGHAAKSPVRAYLHDPVTLHAVLRGREDGRDVAVADPEVLAARALPWALPARPFTKIEAARVSWLKVEPTARDFWNTELPSMKFSWKTVPYRETAVARGVSALVADAKPTTYAGNPQGLGSMRFKLEYEQAGKSLATAGASVMKPTKQDGVFRVQYAGVTRYPLINSALELCNVPYVFGSESPTQKDVDHQSEWAYGVDCADLVSYAARRSGLSMVYGFTGTFDPAAGLTKRVARPAKTGEGGVYLDAKGQPIRWGAGGVEPQDLVLFDGRQRHIGILFEDRPPLGVLDENDVIVHTLCEAPTFVKVSEAYDQPFSIVRLKKPAPLLAAAPVALTRAAAIAVATPVLPRPVASTAAKPEQGPKKSGS